MPIEPPHHPPNPLDDLRMLLTGHVENPRTLLYSHPPGNSGINARVQKIIVVRTFFDTLGRHTHHRFFHSFHDLVKHVLTTSHEAWLLEVLRIMDRPRSMGRANLTIPALHEAVASHVGISASDKADAQRRYDDLHTAYEDGDFRTARNRYTFHLDHEALMADPVPLGDLAGLTDRLVSYYGFIATLVYGDRPRFILDTAYTEAIQRAKTLRRLMVDALRFHRGRGADHVRRQHHRYGRYGDIWVSDMLRGLEDAE
jgi:hypothetical protein